MNIMDFNVKKLAADAGTFLSRAVQVRRRRLRTGRWRRGGRGDGYADDPACCWARPGAPVPPAVSASLAQPPLGAERGEPGRGPERPPPRTPWAHPGPEASVPQRASQGRLSTSAPPPPFPWVALALRAASKEGVSFFLPLCQLCSHQSLAARGGNGNRLSLSAPQLHQGRRKPGIRGALTHSPNGL